MEAEIGVKQNKPRNTQDCQELPGTGRISEEYFPKAMGGRMAPTLISDSGIQIYEE